MPLPGAGERRAAPEAELERNVEHAFPSREQRSRPFHPDPDEGTGRRATRSGPEVTREAGGAHRQLTREARDRPRLTGRLADERERPGRQPTVRLARPTGQLGPAALAR